ncbi:hypothetical protein [Bordetella pertussis]|nr:hypothetical protein [Bordetella pertussis]WDH94479.1 hypothetical protein PUN72_07200 [Bordetella pertussis]WDI06271.1 hypothetical protein PUN73_14875 [Bordetella pertussis]WDI15609.1 hypothetical protein PUO33_08260 [Bordetella pertussis]WIQ64725.1 hypothetical protein HDL79_06225 [Bordetella pertussis]WIQ86557.1 hypothetical protein HDL73_06340 [Bordetella pertussis]
MPGRSSMPICSRFQNASTLPSTVVANGRVRAKAPLAWRMSQAGMARSWATARALRRPAMASISSSAMGMDAVMPVVVTTPWSATTRRSAT